MYTVYVHKNLKNEKYYVGCTSQEPKERWDSGWGYQYNKSMWNDIKESNWNTDWFHGILGKFENKDEALKYEAFLIAMLGSIENGYNTSAYYSHSCKHSEESKKKISEALTGRVFTEESKKKMSEAHGVNGIIQYSKSGKLIAEYPSTREAEHQTGCSQSNICKCCKGKRKSAGGYIWKYK